MRALQASRHCGFRSFAGLCVLAALVLSALLALVGGSANPATAAPSQSAPVVPGELIVGFERSASQAQQNSAVAQAGAAREASFSQIKAVLIRVPPNLAAAATKLLLGLPQVRYVEPNHVVRTVEAVPNDPSLSQLWGLSNTGQTGGTADADIDAPEAWDLATGDSNVVVAVTDTGVDFSHPDLAAQRWVNTDDPFGGGDQDGNGLVDDWSGWDFVNDDNDAFDDNQHGTHVSGTVGAVGDNGVGVVGVNWNVKIMPLKFLNAAGSGSTADAIAATLYAADQGADIASNSWGGGPFDQALLDAIEYGAARGMLFVAAAGNDGRSNETTPTYPANYASEAIVSVAATDHADALAFFSNYGATTVDLGAPGVNILSTTPGNTYGSFSGTSMATPHVAGAAALLKARFPDASLYGLKNLLLRSVDPIASLSGRTTTGGRLNLYTGVSCDNEPKVWLGSPVQGFVAGVGDVLAVNVLGSNCATPAGLANVAVTVNGTPVTLAAATPDGLYRGTYTVAAAGPLTVEASVRTGGLIATQTVTGTASVNYTCAEAPFAWVDVRPGTRLTTASGSDDNFSTLAIGFPVSYFGQSYNTAYVSSNGFLTLGSSAGAGAHLNAAVPTFAAPNALVAPFWDDLNPSAVGAAGGVYAGVSGTAPNRTLHLEWFNVPHFSLSGSGTVTFEVSIKETGEVRFQYQDADFGNATWNFGASATAGLERADGVVGRQVSFNQPQLTNGRSVSCTFGAAPPPPPPPLSITTESLPGSTVGSAYSQTLAATGGTAPYSWSLASGALPPGLSLSSAGVVSGTPTAAGAFNFEARASDSGSPSQSDTQALSITVAPAPLVVTTASLAGGTVGAAYSQTLAATGGTQPYSWSLHSGTLPAGLALSGAGVLSGTPTAAGAFEFVVKATDTGTPSQTATKPFSVTVAPPPLAVATASLPGGTVGTAYSQALTATGGTSPYFWSLPSGALPAGLSLSAAGVVSGTPTAAGTFNFTVQATDSGSPAQTATKPLSIVVASSGPTQVTAVPSATTITTGTLRSGSAASLSADDNSYFEVNSTTSSTRTTDWYGTFTGVTNSLSNLRVSYTGKNSQSCTQVVYIWRWSTSSWRELSSRTVGTTEVALVNLVPSGSAANYVSGTSGDGEVRVRVRCRRSSPSFFASGDLLQISYVRP